MAEQLKFKQYLDFNKKYYGSYADYDIYFYGRFYFAFCQGDLIYTSRYLNSILKKIDDEYVSKEEYR